MKQYPRVVRCGSDYCAVVMQYDYDSSFDIPTGSVAKYISNFQQLPEFPSCSGSDYYCYRVTTAVYGGGGSNWSWKVVGIYLIHSDNLSFFLLGLPVGVSVLDVLYGDVTEEKIKKLTAYRSITCIM